MCVIYTLKIYVFIKCEISFKNDNYHIVWRKMMDVMD